MSGFSETNTLRINKIYEFSKAIVNGIDPSRKIKENKYIIDTIQASEIIIIVDKLVSENMPVEKLKKGVNKLINLFYKTLDSYNYPQPEVNSFLYCLIQNNKELDKRLKDLRILIKKINKYPVNKDILFQIKQMFSDIEKSNKHYQIKENILFPKLEEKWKDYRCLQLMWSFHDDIRKNIKKVLKLLTEENFDLKLFNKITGSIFFNIYAIIFREEKILFPLIMETLQPEELNFMLQNSIEIGFPYFNPKIITKKESDIDFNTKAEIDLKSGFVTSEQIRLIFNHLPVEITFVDENNKVKYFSTPKKRTFPRTNSIIGREVKNCHPPESVHVVNKIIKAFKKGEKNETSFWIKIQEEFILIQYFAIRNESGKYKGVVEVSQEITDIKKLKGEKRLLDWQ